MQTTVTRIWPLLPMLALAVCASAASAQLSPFVEPPVAADVNPDPTIVEVFLEAAEADIEYVEGVATSVFAYNGSIPGPTIEANLGDTLIVHFTNNLSEETTVHWHGVETPAIMDGSHIAQRPVAANGGTFTYEFTLLDASLFWYHPHVRTDVQVEKGLYGALLVHDPVTDAALGLPTSERILILDDVQLDESGQIAPAIPSDPLEKVTTILNGRLGEVLLVNGVPAPVSLPVTNGVPERWRIVNVANSRFFRMGWDGDQTIWRIGGDGGLLEHPLEPQPYVSSTDAPDRGGSYEHGGSADPNEGIFLTNGERADVVWEPFANDGGTQLVSNYDWHKGSHSAAFDPRTGNIVLGDLLSDGTAPSTPLLLVEVSGPLGGGPLYEPPALLSDIEELDPNEVVGTMTLHMGHTPPPLPPSGDVGMFIQLKAPGQPIPFAQLTSLDARDVLVGETWIWEVVNLSHMDHPFHTHGFFFEPFEIEYQDDVVPANNIVVPVEVLERKDTVRVPARLGEPPGTSRTILRAYVKFDDTGREGLVRAEGLDPSANDSGGWLAHCHILEHAASGMMTFFETRYADQTFWLLGAGLAGTTGIPQLRGSGQLTSGSPVALDLTGAVESTPVFLFLGFDLLAEPFRQGVLVPTPDLLFTLGTDGAGELHLADTWPPGMAAGTELFWQAWLPDAGAPAGAQASNAIKSITP